MKSTVVRCIEVVWGETLLFEMGLRTDVRGGCCEERHLGEGEREMPKK